jgi:osmotically-inducible protein OsmY
MTAIQAIKKNDAEIKTDVLAELEYDPSIKVTDIGVSVKNGTVTLNGFVTSYREKGEAVRVVKRVTGVRAIADDIEVKLSSFLSHSDGDIAAAAANHISWDKSIPADSVKVLVREGEITLEGEVEWWYQKNDVESVVQHLSGVKGVSNRISIKPRITATAVENAIHAAFKRNSLMDADRIKVETAGGKVTLRGSVRNFAEKEESERVAWAAPGVFHVDNQLVVRWLED